LATEKDEMVERERLAKSLLASTQSANLPSREAQDLARNAAQAIWLRDERIRTLEAWLKARVDDELGLEDAVHHLLPESISTEWIKRAYEACEVQFHVPIGPLVPDPHLGASEERDRLARTFEALRRLDHEVRDRAKAIFAANQLDEQGFAASVTFRYVPEWDRKGRDTKNVLPDA
jgi:hypothetical protein